MRPVSAAGLVADLTHVDPRFRRQVKNRSFSSRIDSLVAAKLEKLGILPSPVCSDAEFLRRVSIDLTGTLPAPDEVERFLTDRSTGKRFEKIEQLLERPAYAAWWANKLCDFTGCNPRGQAELVHVDLPQAWRECAL